MSNHAWSAFQPSSDDYFVKFDCGCVVIFIWPSYTRACIQQYAVHEGHDYDVIERMFAQARERLNEDIQRRSALN